MKKELLHIVQSIPYGMVSSYGLVAMELDKRYQIQSSGWLVGRVLSHMKSQDTGNLENFFPWWRVVNKQGLISTLKLGQRGLDQIRHLESEGIVLQDKRVDMKRYGYTFL